MILRHYLDVENGDYYRALGRYNGSLGRPEYPTARDARLHALPATRPSALADPDAVHRPRLSLQPRRRRRRPPRYRGRFAPSPTGPLHFGSLVAALASYCDARAAGGEWLLRIEDVDAPRAAPGASASDPRDARALRLRVGRPSRAPIGAHRALRRRRSTRLRARGLVYACACTRRELEPRRSAPAASASIRARAATASPPRAAARSARAWRVRVGDARIDFADRLQGPQAQDLARDVGDFVVRRADGLFAYQLAVVVDDAAQGDHRCRARRRPARVDAAADPAAAAARLADAVVSARAGRDRRRGREAVEADRRRAAAATIRCRRWSPRGGFSTSRCRAIGRRRASANSGACAMRAWTPRATAAGGDAPAPRAIQPSLVARRIMHGLRAASSCAVAFARALPRSIPHDHARRRPQGRRNRHRRRFADHVRRHPPVGGARPHATTRSSSYKRHLHRPVRLAPRTSSCSRACSPSTTTSTSRTRPAIFETFRKLHPILKEQHFLNPKEEEDDPYESTQITALIANAHGIFGVYSMREVFEYTQFWAAGIGPRVRARRDAGAVRRG